jgi:hypothetical protein
MNRRIKGSYRGEDEKRTIKKARKSLKEKILSFLNIIILKGSKMSYDENMLQQLKSEAEANYRANRWEDSAKTYEHLVGLAQKNGDLALAIDFALAAIRSWNQMPEKADRVIRLYQAIGLLGLKQGAIGFEDLARKAESKEEITTAANNYDIAAQGYNYIQNYNLAEKCFRNALELFKELVKETQQDKEYEKTIHLLDKSIQINERLSKILQKKVIDNPALAKSENEEIEKEVKTIEKKIQLLKKEKANTHELIADDFVEKNNPDYLIIARKEYQKAVDIYEEMNENKRVEKIKEKMIKT